MTGKFNGLLMTGGMLLALACAEGTPQPATPMQPAAGETAPSAPEGEAPMAPGIAAVDTAELPQLGAYLVDSAGRSLYMFMADKQSGASTCYDACARAWPPLITSGRPNAIGGRVDQDKLGVIARNDGTLQVTYDGWPLYHYAGDERPGDTAGHDMMDFGAEWYLVSPTGAKIEHESEPEAPEMEPESTEPTEVEPPMEY